MTQINIIQHIKILVNVKLILFVVFAVYSNMFVFARKLVSHKINGNHIEEMWVYDAEDYYPEFVAMWNNDFHGIIDDSDSTLLIPICKIRLPEDSYSVIYTRDEHYFLVPNEVITTYNGEVDSLLLDMRCYVLQASPPISDAYYGKYRDLFLNCNHLKSLDGEYNLPREKLKRQSYVKCKFSIEPVEEFIVYLFKLDLYNINNEFLFCAISDGCMIKPIQTTSEIKYIRVAFPIIKNSERSKNFIQANRKYGPY